MISPVRTTMATGGPRPPAPTLDGPPLSSRSAALLALVIPSLVSAISTGCAGYRALDLPPEPAHMQESPAESAGLTVAAKLVAGPEGLERYFGQNLRSAGYFAVLVNVESRGQEPVAMERTSFAVVLENGQKFEPVSPAEVLADMRVSSVNPLTVILAPLVFPLVIGIQHAGAYNFDMARDFQRKSFPQVLRLERGDAPLSRALFFRDPREGPRRKSDFNSSVLQLVADFKGSEVSQAAEAGSSLKPTDERRPTLGRRVPLTVSLTLLEI